MQGEKRMLTEQRKSSLTLEIWGDGRTVWVNDSEGCCVGRFCRAGVDIHHGAETQVQTGQQCLDCKSGPMTLTDWEHFRGAMRHLYDAEVSEELRPEFLDVPALAMG
jgi:hypothetical protein